MRISQVVLLQHIAILELAGLYVSFQLHPLMLYNIVAFIIKKSIMYVMRTRGVSALKVFAGSTVTHLRKMK